MINTNRRDILRLGSASLALPFLATSGVSAAEPAEGAAPGKVQYLEIVSPEADAICKTYERLHGVTFGDKDPNLGNARVAQLADGGYLAVRAPLRPTETPVVRPYFLVEDIEAAVAAAAAEAGAEIALPPMELPGHGRCAIFIQGGAEHGLWER